MDDWLSLALSTERIDFRAAKEAILNIYREHDLLEPEVYYCKSPADLIYYVVKLYRGSEVARMNQMIEGTVELGCPWQRSYKVRSRSYIPWYKERLLLEGLKNAFDKNLSGAWSRPEGITDELKAVRLFDAVTATLVRWGRFSDFPSGWKRMKECGISDDWAWARGAVLTSTAQFDKLGNPLSMYYRRMDEAAGINQTSVESNIENHVWLAQNSYVSVGFLGYAFVMERPTGYSFNDEGQLHNWPNPAVTFRDGSGIYRVGGLPIPKMYGELNFSKIDSQSNVEVRRVLRAFYGTEKYLKEADAEVIDKSEYGTLWRWFDREGGVRMIELVNSTPEPDGSFKHYFLRVPGWMQTAKEAVAWTFNMHSDEYAPLQQS